MELERILDRCRELELRAAAVYRTFAASVRGRPEACALWTQLAREEEQHAQSIARARGVLGLKGKSRVSIDGWGEVLAEVDVCLTAAERLGASATTHQQVAAALDLEMTELEAARQAVLAAAHAPAPDAQEEHADRLARFAETLGDDPHVRLQLALLRARTRIQSA